MDRVRGAGRNGEGGGEGRGREREISENNAEQFREIL